MPPKSSSKKPSPGTEAPFVGRDTLPEISSVLENEKLTTDISKTTIDPKERIVVEIQQKIREKLTAEILDSLRDDEITEIVRHDEMILTFGEEKLKGVLSDKFNNNYVSEIDHIRQIMRRAGKYLYCFRKVVGDENLTLVDSFKNQQLYHNRLPEIGELLSDNYSHPFNIDNTRMALRNILEIFTLKEFNKEARELWGHIIDRFTNSWRTVLNKHALRSKTQLNKEKKMIFPSESDYKRLLRHLEKQLKIYTDKKITTYSEYLQMSRLVLTKITLFNHRRSGEVARMTIDEFERRDKEPDIKEYKSQLTKLEIALAKSVDIVTLKGKSAKNELVIAILLPECRAAIQKLLECKNQFPFLRDNKFVFAVRGYRRYHLNGYKAIQKIVSESRVKNAKVFTAGRIRKNICTRMVWMNLDDATKKLLISQLGHLPSIHQDVYEEHVRSGFGQFTKLPAILLQYDAHFQGVNDDEKLIECLKMSSDRLGNESDAENIESESSTDSESDVDGEGQRDQEALAIEPQRRSERLKSCIQKRSYVYSSCSEDDSQNTQDAEFLASNEEESEDEILNRAKIRLKKRKTFPRKKIQMVKWDGTMNRILGEIFHQELQNHELPIKSKKLRECQSRFTQESGKTVSISSIKTTLYNIKHGHRRLDTV